MTGLAGVIVIAASNNARSKGLNVLACLAILGSEISWSIGTVSSKVMALPESKSISAGAQMMCGGLLILMCAAFLGELTPPPHVALAAALALIYLIIAGSLVAFTAYTWLLARMPATKVASYAYVNPVVALAIGYALGGESIHVSTLLGSGLVLVSVVLLLTIGRDRQAATS